MNPSRHPLPVDGVLDELVSLLAGATTVVLRAPPGTGKTTRVPPALLEAPWRDGRIVVLEPRRVAARAAAERMASERGERVGTTIGLRTRFDTRVSASTELEVVTEGVLTRMLLEDPGLRDVSVIVFDEFHERSIHTDTSFAFVRETIDVLRSDLRVMVMSATLSTDGVAAQVGAHAVVDVDAPLFPVETVYRQPGPGRTPEAEVADAVVDALETSEGDILVFLAGAGDIRRAERDLAPRLPETTVVTPLHGSLSPHRQDLALQPDPDGRRKIVLATPIAETSVTIDGVRTVIDTGRRRRPEVDPGRGMSRLVTVAASRAATDQRRGRAGRQGPGICVRLWPEIDQARRRPAEPPEILTADLTSLALDLAAWGASDADEVPWLDPPPAPALAAARSVLGDLGAIDDQLRLTPHGREMVALGAEPRLAHLVLRATQLGYGGTGCDVAALLSERDLFQGRDRPVDLRLRLDALRSSHSADDGGGRRRVRELARRWRARMGAGDDPADPDCVGLLVSLAYPDRVAQRRTEAGSFLLSSGAGASTPADDGLAREPLLAVAELEGMGDAARIVTAAPLTRDDLERVHGDRLESTVRGGWDRRRRDVVFERQVRLGALVLQREADPAPDRRAVEDALLAGVRREGLGLLGWTAAARRWRERAQFLHQHLPGWPAFDDDTLLAELDDWLRPHLVAAHRRTDLETLDVKAALETRLDGRQARDLDRQAPTHVTVPSGSRLPIDYAAEGGPVLAVRLQEIFGLRDTPTVADGTVPLVVHLLSPAHRPVQVTRDLASFWADGYAEVRRELRGRYPRHSWPEDPTTAAPTRQAKRRRKVT